MSSDHGVTREGQERGEHQPEQGKRERRLREQATPQGSEHLSNVLHGLHEHTIDLATAQL